MPQAELVLLALCSSHASWLSDIATYPPLAPLAALDLASSPLLVRADTAMNSLLRAQAAACASAVLKAPLFHQHVGNSLLNLQRSPSNGLPLSPVPCSFRHRATAAAAAALAVVRNGSQRESLEVTPEAGGARMDRCEHEHDIPVSAHRCSVCKRASGCVFWCCVCLSLSVSVSLCPCARTWLCVLALNCILHVHIVQPPSVDQQSLQLEHSPLACVR